MHGWGYDGWTSWGYESYLDEQKCMEEARATIAALAAATVGLSLFNIKKMTNDAKARCYPHSGGPSIVDKYIDWWTSTAQPMVSASKWTQQPADPFKRPAALDRILATSAASSAGAPSLPPALLVVGGLALVGLLGAGGYYAYKKWSK